MSPHLTFVVAAVFVWLVAPAIAAGGPQAASTPAAVEPGPDQQKPVLSNLGKKRVRENLAILDNNIHDLKENLDATHKNLDTIKGELKDLDSLEAEHLQLKKKYQAYLEYAQRELRKNEKSTEDLEKWEKTITKSGQSAEDKALKEKLETARLERADRARWKTDAQSKMSRVNDLMKSLLDNLRDIRSRRGPLQEQLGQWTQRQTQYEGLLTEMNQRKSDMEELLRK